jgi:uncharacterized protein
VGTVDHSNSNLMRVSKLYRYPVKSMGGEELQSTRVALNGIAGDRRLAIVDVETGEVACAKVPRKWGGLLNFSAKYVSDPVPGKPLPPVEIEFPDGSVRRSDSAKIDAELSAAIGRDVRLAFEPPPGASSEAIWGVVEEHETTEWTRQRTVRVEGGNDIIRWALAEAVPKVEGEDGFFDLAPIHILTTSTLRYLEELTPGVTFDHRRFRPNILLETSKSGFVEQEWVGKSMWFDQVGMSVMLPAMRCAMPTLPQLHAGLQADRRILQSLARHNMLELEGLGSGRWACAGIFASLIIAGEIKVGTSMELKAADRGGSYVSVE